MDQDMVSQEENGHGTRGMLVGLICAIVVAVAGVAFGVYGMVTRGDGEPSASQDNIEDTDEEIAVQMMAEDYNEVFEVMKKVADGIGDGGDWFYVENGSGLAYQPEGLDTHVPMRMQLEAEFYDLGSMDESVTAVRDQLVKNGFEYVGKSPILGSAGPEVYEYLLGDTVCGVYGNQTWLSIDSSREYAALECAKTDWAWLTDEDKELANALAAAYHNQTGKDLSVIDTTVSLSSRIKDSEYAPYQTLTVGVGGAGGDFYRVSPEAEWQFFTARQDAPDCGDYDTEDLKKAYLGRICYVYDEENGVRELKVEL